MRVAYLVSHAGHVANRFITHHFVVAVVVEPAVRRAPTLEAPLGGHEGSTIVRAVVEAHLRGRTKKTQKAGIGVGGVGDSPSLRLYLAVGNIWLYLS